MNKVGLVPIIALCHLTFFCVVVLRQPRIPEEIRRIKPSHSPIVEPEPDGGMSFTIVSHPGTALFGRDYQIAYSGVLLKMVTILALPAFVLAFVAEGILISSTNLSLGARSHIVGVIAVLGIVLQWFALASLRRRRASTAV